MRKFILLPLVMLFFNGSISAQKIAGFFPDWLGGNTISELNRVQYDKLTDIYYAFLYPNNNGNLNPTTAGGLQNVLQPLVDRAHPNGVRVHVSIGGANSSGSFSTVVSNPQRRQNFVNDLANIMTTYDLDGVDIDWEFPGAQDANNLALLMQEIRDRLDQLEVSMGKRLYLSMAVAPLVWNNGGINATSIALSDYIHVMAFDASGACCVCDNNHSSFLIAERALRKWTTGLASTCGGNSSGMNTPEEKLVLSIPFYSTSSGYQAYKNFSSADPDGYFNDPDGLRGGRDYNSCPMIQEKAELIMETYNGAGLWTWELSQDRDDQYSLVSCMYDALQPYGCEAPTPELGENQSICGVGSITLNSNVTTASGRTFTWKRNGNTIVNASSTASTYSATQSGTYTVEVNQGGCSNSDEIEVSGTLQSFSLGDDIDLCSPTQATISANVQTNGRTLVWRKDGSIISGENGTSITVSEPGNYSLTVSASGCSNVSSSLNVTSSLPQVTSDTICTADQAELISNTEVEWYDAQVNGSLLGSGTSLNHFVTQTETIWVEAVGAAQSENTIMKNSFGGSWYQTNVYGTRFTVETDLVLKSVDVDAEGGSVTINITEDDGTTVVESKTFPSVTDLTTLDLDFTLSPGTYFIHAIGSQSRLWVDAGAASANFNIPGVITVEGNAYWDWGNPTGANFQSSNQYGNFINLVVATGSSCDRVPVYAVVDPSNEECLITSSFELNNNNPKIFPNPSTDKFTLEIPSGIDIKWISIYDALGKLIENHQVNSNNFQFGSNLAKGVYFMDYEVDGLTKRFKLIKK